MTHSSGRLLGLATHYRESWYFVILYLWPLTIVNQSAKRGLIAFSVVCIWQPVTQLVNVVLTWNLVNMYPYHTMQLISWKICRYGQSIWKGYKTPFCRPGHIYSMYKLSWILKISKKIKSGFFLKTNNFLANQMTNDDSKGINNRHL